MSSSAVCGIRGERITPRLPPPLRPCDCRGTTRHSYSICSEHYRVGWSHCTRAGLRCPKRLSSCAAITFIGRLLHCKFHSAVRSRFVSLVFAVTRCCTRFVCTLRHSCFRNGPVNIVILVLRSYLVKISRNPGQMSTC